MASDLYIGLMSGTSMDGIDAALVDFSKQTPYLIASHSHKIPSILKNKLKLLTLNSPQANIDMLGEADTELGLIFADAVNSLLTVTSTKSNQIQAIGSHGHTIRHRPDLTNNFSMQIGDPNRISYLTGITTIADFRRKDIAAGGEGAPLAPAFHQQVFSNNNEKRAILNIGGIANITFLASGEQPCIGFDTGPGNTLMDAWIQKHKNKAFDKNGEWAANSSAHPQLITQLMQDAFVLTKPPKSSGREHYNLQWLEQQLTSFTQISIDQVQASLCHFTCDSIVYAIQQQQIDIDTLIVCGGGAHNIHLMKLLNEKLTNINVQSSQVLGISPDWVEAIAFAWLAKQTMNNLPGNLPNVTGAKKPLVLGAIYPA